jgi:T5orf172 domain
MMNASTAINRKAKDYARLNYRKMSDETGYIYCMTSPSYPGVCKIGCVWKEGRVPTDRLREANSCTWHIPDYKIEFAKKVTKPKEKEEQIHGLLEQFATRVHPGREFFSITPEKTKYILRLVEGENWVQPFENTVEEVEVTDDTQRGCREMKRCFKNGQRIRHTFGDDTWIGIYDSQNDTIIRESEIYKTISAFSMEHHRACNPSRKTSNGWIECQCEIDGVWVSTSTLSELIH